ncbi:MAG: transcriptional repressor, partial [Opitutaceae bacterium]
MAATEHSEALTQRLADRDLRSTPQREVVYDVLLKKRDHPTADEVFSRVKSELP